VRRFILRIPTFKDKSRVRSTDDIDDFGKDFVREMGRLDSLADAQAERDALMAQASTVIAPNRAVRVAGYFQPAGADISQLSPPKSTVIAPNKAVRVAGYFQPAGADISQLSPQKSTPITPNKAVRVAGTASCTHHYW